MSEQCDHSEPNEMDGLLAAFEEEDKNGATSRLARRILKGNLSPWEASSLCKSAVSNGLKPLARDIVKYCDVRAARHTEIVQIRKHVDFEYMELPEVKIWLGGTVSIHPLAPAIEIGLLHHGFKAQVKCGGFDMLHQDFFNAESGLYAFNPDFVVLAYDLSHLTPEIVAPRRTLSQADEYINQGVKRLQESLAFFRSRSSATVLIHTLPKNEFPELGYSDLVSGDSSFRLHIRLNLRIASLSEAIDGVHIVDLARLADEMGLRRFQDERRRFYASYPASADAMTSWGILIADCVNTVKKGPRKVIALDLDGTLWGGIVGELGPLGVDVGPQYPGNAYLEFQRNLLDLKAQGVLLSICSKNDENVALSVFKSHPHMAIRLDDIASYQIGWDPKPKGLKQISLDLNLGLDSFVFLDDSRHERAAVRQAFPEVHTPDLPNDPVDRPAFLTSIRELWPLLITDSDSKRTELYIANRKRKKLQAESEDYSRYLMNLEQVLHVGLIEDHDWNRVAQMHVRTNQFNMTTRRHNEADLRAIWSKGGRIFTGNLEDCFGHQGIVVTAVVIPENDTWIIDSFLMSCRVMSRDVEASFLNYIVCQANSHGVRSLFGEYIPTERNRPAAGFYKSFGFTGCSITDDSISRWWKLDTSSVSHRPSTVKIVERSNM